MRQVLSARLFCVLVFVAVLACGEPSDKPSRGHEKPPDKQSHTHVWKEILFSHQKSLNLSTIACSDSMAVAAGTGGIAYSRDGLAWQDDLRGLRYGQRVVWNDSAFFIFSAYQDLVSSRGYQWDTLARASHTGFNFADWFDTMFIASDDGMQIQACLYSKTGVDWAGKYATVGHPFLGIANRDSLYVAVGDRIMISTDAMMWSEVHTPVEFYMLIDITHNDTAYVAVGTYGTIMTSKDGLVWERRRSDTGKDLNGIAWSGNEFAAVGGESDASAVIVTSYDGVNWKRVFEHNGGRLTDIVWYRGRFIAVGEYGLIVISTSVTDP